MKAELTVRPARREDGAEFMILWRRYLEELLAFGSEIALTERTRAFFQGVFDRAAEGGPCVALVAELGGEIVGVHLSDASGLPWDTTAGRCAVAFGTFVLPEARRCGTANALRVASLRAMRELGCDAVAFSLYQKNEAGRASLRAWPGIEELNTTYLYRMGDA